MFRDFLLGWVFNKYIITDSGPIPESKLSFHHLHLLTFIYTNCIPNPLSALRLLAVVLQYHYSYYCRKTGAILVTLRHLKEFHQWAQKLREKNGRAKLYTMEHRVSSE